MKNDFNLVKEEIKKYAPILDIAKTDNHRLLIIRDEYSKALKLFMQKKITKEKWLLKEEALSKEGNRLRSKMGMTS